MSSIQLLSALATLCALACLFFASTCRIAVKRARALDKQLHDMTMRAQQLHAANVAGDKAYKAMEYQHARLKKKLRGLSALQRRNMGITPDE